MKNELMIVDKVEKQLRTPRKDTVFPLTPTHRKELRQLRDANIGNLLFRVRTIEDNKKEEYIKKYQEDIQKEIGNRTKDCDILNSNFDSFVKKINDLITARIEFEEKINLKSLQLQNDWNDISRLSKINPNRSYSFDKKQISKKIATDEFKDKYGKPFEKVKDMIDKIKTQYEEAINFGDLELVRQLYYTMKDSDKMFKQISGLKI